MHTTGKFTTRFPCVVGLILISLWSYAQTIDLDPGKWANLLNKKGKEGNDNFAKLDSVLMGMDSVTTFHFLDKLVQQGKNEYHFQVRFSCLKAHLITWQRFDKNQISAATYQRKGEIMNLFAEAMDRAYRSEDDHLIALASKWYAQIMIHFDEVGLAVMYSVNSMDLNEKLGYNIMPYDYQFLSEMLYRVREYNSSIKYAHKAVDAWIKYQPVLRGWNQVSCLNTIALGFHRQNIYDSALVYYNEALQLAKKANAPVWTGIVSGNLAQLYYAQKRYDSAYVMFTNDYKTSKDSGYYDNASNSLQWAARTSVALGHTETALREVREAFALTRLWPDAGYLRNTYYTAVQIFREMKNYDSAFYYNSLYTALNDSLEKIVSRSSIEISKARLNDEASRYNIATLNRERKAQLVIRNIIIVAIVVLSIFALLIVNRKILKTKMKMEKLKQEKLLMAQEMASAGEQLKMFTANIVEKTNLIEKLESQIKGKEATSEQHAIINELSRHTILSEDDWNKFRLLFEAIHPGFFIKLKERFPDITVAEQRMASLTRLRLTTKQIASMLGISVDSVHKSRQRLRQRLQVATEVSLDELVGSL